MKNNTGTGIGICQENAKGFKKKAFVVSELCSKNLKRGWNPPQS